MQAPQNHTQPQAPQSQELFAKQEEELVRAYEKLRKTARNKIRKINEGKLVLTDKDSQKMTQNKKKAA